MHRLSVVSLSVLLLCLVTTVGYADTVCRDTSELENLQCKGFLCVDTIEVRKCLDTDDNNMLCDSCAVKKLCCGVEICNASRMQDCDESSRRGNFESFLRIQKEDPTQLASYYAVDCQGQFVSLKDMFRDGDASNELDGTTLPAK